MLMPVETLKPKAKATKRRPIPAKWRKLFALIPGYDPIKTAAPGDWFDAKTAQKYCDFFPECLTHVEGRLAGRPFILERWQQAFVGCLFGWMNSAGFRRYREALLYIGRKNGKTTLTAGIVLLLLFVDGEPGANIYSAAAEKDQASIIYRHAKTMVEAEPVLLAEAKIYRSLKAIEFPRLNSVYRPISAEAFTKHGYNPHGIIIDELHAQKKRDLVDAFTTALGARDQPLLVYLTTADIEGESICNEKHGYACRVRDGTFEDSSFLPMIFEALPEDDWKSPATWRKANPNLGVSISETFVARECRRAQESPIYEGTFKRLHLNMITPSISAYIPKDVWDACCHPLNDLSLLKGRKCYGGLDLSSIKDTTALVWAFPPIDKDPFFRLLPRIWIPGRSAEERERSDRVPYGQWKRDGHVIFTPGNRVQYSAIEQQIKDDAKAFSVVDIAADPWSLEYLRQRVTEYGGPEIVVFRQGWRSMSAPCKEFDRMAAEGELAHDGNPCLRWQIGNVLIEQDKSENWRPIKEENTPKRIDAAVSAIMAIGRSMIDDENAGTSIYDTDKRTGLVTI